MAVAPDGRVGVVWYRYLWNSSNQQSNYNIHWAALNTDGDLVAGPINVTNNSVWGVWSDLNFPQLYNPVIAAITSNRFVLSWEKYHQENAGDVQDIWYAVLASTGGVVRNPTKLTDDTAGGERNYSSPALAQLTGNRALVILSKYSYPPGVRDIQYAVLDGDGGVLRGLTQLTSGPWEYRPDAIQLANGRTVVAWSGEIPSRVGEQGWTGQYFNNETLSGTPVLTRTDPTISFRWNLGSPDPAINADSFFRTSQATAPYIFSSVTGYGNTTHSWTPPAGVDSMLSATPAVAGGAPGGAAAPFTVKLQGRGGSPATSVRLVATLDPRLSYVSDTSGVTPTVSGQTVNWNLPDLRLFDIRQFQLSLAVAGAALGERLPVQLQLTSAEPDLTPANNQADVQVWMSKPVYLPALIKQ